MTITYTQVGDYLLPNLVPPESPKVGRWGMLRHSYLRNHREGLYTGMLMKGTLNAHLEEIDRQANEMEKQLISQLARGKLAIKVRKITDLLKKSGIILARVFITDLILQAGTYGFSIIFSCARKRLNGTVLKT